AAVVRQVFEPLLIFDKDLKPVPAAASGYDVSQDGKTYTFHLRQGAKWSDGQPVTAKDFVYSFKRILDPATAAEYASFFADAGIKPTLQKVTYLMVTSGEADYAAYRNNERDWTLVPDADVQAVRSDAQLSKEAVDYTELTTFWLIMNNARPPLNNPMVRKALSKAIDRNALIRDIAAGVGKPATSMIPPGMPGYQPDLGKDIDFDAA